MRRHRVIRRTLRAILIGLLVVVALLVAIAGLLSLSPVRRHILDEALEAARRSLPGDFRVEQAGWPSLGTVALGGVLWTDEQDTLVAAQRVELATRIWPLLRRDLHVERIRLDSVRVDVGAIQRAFPADAEAPAPKPEADGGQFGIPFFRPGAWSPLPSVAADEVQVSLDRLELPDGSSILNARLSVGLDLLVGHEPRLSVEELTAASPSQGWWLDRFVVATSEQGRRAHGEIGARLGNETEPWPIDLAFRLEGSDLENQDLRLVLETENEQAGQPTLRADVHAGFEDLRPRSVRFEVRLTTPSTGELADVPLLAPRLEGVPDLAGIQVDVAGEAQLVGELSSRVALRLAPNDWLEGGLVDARSTGTSVQLDSLELRLPDLVVAASGRMDSDDLEAAASLRVTGSRWLTTLVPDLTAPDSLDVRLTATASGSPAAPAVQARLQAAAATGGFTLQRLDLEAGTPALFEDPIAFDLVGRALDMELAVQGRVQPGDTLDARLYPLRLRDASSPPSSRGLEEPASLSFVPSTGAVRLQRLRLVGDAGQFRLDGALDAARQGEFDLTCSWNEPPPLLLARLGLEEGQRESLQTAWQQQADGFTLSLGGSVDLASGSPAARVTGSFTLPGPAALAPLLPSSARVEDLGPLQGHLQLDTGPAPAWTGVSLDLEDTGWIDTGRVEARLRGSEVELDSLRLAMEGLSLRAAGSLADTLDLTGAIEIENAGLLSRFVVADPLALALSAQCALQGTRERPLLQGGLQARSVRYGEIHLPALDATAALSASGWEADLQAPQGLTTGSVLLDRIGLRYRSEEVELFPGRLGLSVAGRGLSLQQSLRVARNAGWAVEVDTLDVTVLEKDLKLARPFDLRVEQPGNGIRLSNLALEGSLGSIHGEGALLPDSVEVALDLDLSPPAPPRALAVPPDAWPGSVRLRLRADDRTGVQAQGEISGFVVGALEQLSIRLDAAASPDSTHLELQVHDSGREVVRATVQAPLAVTLVPVRAELRHQPIRCEVALDGFLLPFLTVDADPDKAPILDGRIDLGGTAVNPSLDGDLTARFPHLPELANHRLDVDFRLAVLDPAPGSATPTARAVHRGELSMTARLGNENVDLLSADLSVPVQWNTDSLTVAVDSSRVVDLGLRSERLALTAFNPVLPPDAQLSGTLDLTLAAKGRPRQLDLDGTLRARQAGFSLADGSRVTLDANLGFGGTSQEPRVEGRIDVANGMIRIPEKQKSLHPVEGEAVLWTVEGMERERAPEEDEEEEPVRARPFHLRTDVKVNIPGGFWIRGRNLDVELAGDLTLVQKGESPTVTGELEAIRGSIVFMGRTLDVKRGRVSFYGEDELNPTLDLVLSTKIDDITVEIVITGTALEPELELRSTPEMEQADIMSVLLFGKPSTDLDENQMDLLGQRAADVLAAFAAAELTERLSGQLGVDMVSVRSGRGGDDAGALIVGKYLSTRALLKYEQALQSGQSFFLVLEYALTENFKLDTRYGSQNKSAIELNWSRDY